MRCISRGRAQSDTSRERGTKRYRLTLIVALLAILIPLPATAHDHPYVLAGSIAAPLNTPDSGIDLTVEPLAEWQESCKLHVHFVDNESGEPVPALVRMYDEDGRRVVLKGLMPRSAALTAGSIGDSSFAHMDSWSIVPEECTIEVPQAVLTVEAFHGPDSKRFMDSIDLRGKPQAAVEGRIQRLLPQDAPWYSGNAHLHLQKMTLDEAERYACETAAADGYDLVFFSYLERAEADAHYISNTFTAEDLARFSQRSGVIFGYGEEYRHNFVKNSEGYGHVMFLNLEDLILPASLGYAITHASNDDQPLRNGIVQARAQNATVLWCHGSRGYEDIPNWVAGLVDVQMIFDQGSLGTYETALYRYLDLGLHVPLATGTDWFFRDMAMAYVQVDKPLTKERWLEALRAGRSFITNGPLIQFTVNGQPPGAVINATPGDELEIAASIQCRGDFNDLELVRNGYVVARANAVLHDGRYLAKFHGSFTADDPAWFAVRATPFNATYDKPEEFGVGFNEYGKPYFAHTSAVYVDVDGQPIFDPSAAESLLDEVRKDSDFVASKGDFTSDKERDRVLGLYADAMQSLEKRITTAK